MKTSGFAAPMENMGAHCAVRGSAFMVATSIVLLVATINATKKDTSSAAKKGRNAVLATGGKEDRERKNGGDVRLGSDGM